MPNPILSEIWRDIPGFHGYQVSSWGGMRSHRAFGCQDADSWYYMSPAVHSAGYRLVDLIRDGERHGRLVHRLVLEAFIGPSPKGMECRHLDGNPANNRLDNLMWGTRSENAGDRTRHGRSHRGSKHHNTILDEAKVLEIRQRYAGGELQTDLMAEFGVSRDTIKRILDGEGWAHVPTMAKRRRTFASGSKHGLSKLTEDRVRDIKARLRKGGSIAAIAREIGVSEPCISDIKAGRTWVSVS